MATASQKAQMRKAKYKDKKIGEHLSQKSEDAR